MNTGIPESVLPWDGSMEVNDILENIKNIVHKVTGWPVLKVWLDKSRLNIDCESGSLLIWDIEVSREIYGRLHHVGLHPYIEEMKNLLK